MKKLTISPLLEWKTILSCVFKNRLDLKIIENAWCSNGEHAYWFSRSAWALQAIVLWWETAFGKKSPVCWLPDFFCNQSLLPLREIKAKIHFYPIGENLEPNWDACRQEAQDKPPDIFILVHYFGMAADGKVARRFCNNSSSILVEDAAHVLLPQKEIGKFGDFVCYSLHKLLAIPDGAVLIQREIPKKLRKIVEGDPINTMAQVVDSYPNIAPSNWFWIVKRVLQKIAPQLLLNRLYQGKNPKFNEEASAMPISYTPQQSWMSQRLILAQYSYLKDYCHQRLKNLAVINSNLGLRNDMRPFRKEDSSITSPYLAVYQCQSEGVAENYYKKFVRYGYPVQTWPDLPPEVLSNLDRHKIAVNLRRTVFTLPVHQGLSIGAVYRIMNDLGGEKKVRNRTKSYYLDWFSGNEQQWDRLLCKSGESNVLQSFVYGEAKRVVEGWTVRRGTIFHGTKIIAIFQALVKSKGLIKVVRINRGPIFIDRNLGFEGKKRVYCTIKKYFSLLKVRLLLIAPNLEDTPENRAILELTRFRYRNSEGWSSIWLNLSQSVDELRKNLKGKWRNMLNVANRKDLSIEIGSDSILFEWMMDRYRETMKEKKFQGPDIALLSELKNQLSNKENLLIFRALDSKKSPVASILIIRHGAASTYLIGWNGIEGRRLKANNFLLWNCMLELKKLGCLWFDLGGIDETKTPDITRFKRGMNGHEYRLVGEFLSY